MRYRNLADVPVNRRRARSHVGGLDDASTYDDSTHDGLKAQHRITKREVADLQRKWKEEVPERKEVFHWPDATADHIDVRNGAGYLTDGELITRIVWVADTAPTTGATVQFYLDGVLAWTHVVTSVPQEDQLAVPYAGEPIVAIVTSSDAAVKGLTANLHYR